MTALTRELIRDHREIEQLLDASDRSGTLDTVAFEQFRARLLRHIAIEEKILFPAARRARGGTPLDRGRRLRIEHAAITSLLVPTPDLQIVRELRELLEAHDRLEEGPGGVYADCEAAIGDRWVEVLVLARAYPAVRVAAHFDGRGTIRTAAAALARAEGRAVHAAASPERHR